MIESAGCTVLTMALRRLGTIAGLTGAYEVSPVQALVPYVEVEVGAEREWGHKSGDGREIRLAMLFHDKGERSVRLRQFMSEAEERLGSAALDGDWQLVSLSFVRSQIVRNGAGWMGMLEYRARLLRRS
jgi:hypothetical protein